MLTILEVLGSGAVFVGVILMMIMVWVLLGRFIWLIVLTIRGKTTI